MTTPTQAQIEARIIEAWNASNQIHHSAMRDSRPYLLKHMAEIAALTAAAQVEPKLEIVATLTPGMLALIEKDRNATIERCAQVVQSYIESLTDPKSDFMTKWDQIRHLVETHKGSDLPRLNFESVIETLAEDAAAAIRKLNE